LHMPQGRASEELYEARVTRVLDFLRDKGVDANKISVDLGLPGGDGLASPEVANALSAGKDRKGAAKAPTTPAAGNVPKAAVTGGATGE
ncbi:MAG: hypothetical protein HY706_00165, partial [Candidatus Hydrogenedentes bacterium]|nr:hypothetical protein [Candidatus Hydrogenedentota bacterium]